MRQHSENSINYRVLCKTSPFVKTTSEKADRSVRRLAVWPLVGENDDRNQTTTETRSGCRETATNNHQWRRHPFGMEWREFDEEKNQMGRKTEFYGKEAGRDKEARDLAAKKPEG